MKIYHSIQEMIGQTPILQLHHIEKQEQTQAHLFAKLEYYNPAGSVKDRVARGMLLDALESGKLQPGATIIEPTSGNTGIGLCAIGTALGFEVIIVMPDTMSEERRKLMKAFGAKLVLTPGQEGMTGAIEKAEELVTVDSLVLVQNDIKKHLQAIADAKVSQKSVYYEHTNYIRNKYFCIDADQVVVVINDEKYNDFNGYCQGLHFLESNRKKRVSIDDVKIDDLNCVKSIHVTQSYIEK